MEPSAIISHKTSTGFIAFSSWDGTADRSRILQDACTHLGCNHPVYLDQIHSGICHPVNGKTVSGLAGDAMICLESGVLIGVFTADCVPIVLTGPGCVGVIHAGWRGFVNHIFRSFFQQVPCEPGEMRAIIGPAICETCYEVGPEVAMHFAPEEIRIFRSGTNPHLDLPAAARNRLLKHGLARERILNVNRCTACESPALPSHRKTKTPARLLTAVVRRG